MTKPPIPATVNGWTVGSLSSCGKWYQACCPRGHKHRQRIGAIKWGRPAPCLKCAYAEHPETKPKRGEPLPAIGTRKGNWIVANHETALRGDKYQSWVIVARCSCPSASLATFTTTQWKNMGGRKCRRCVARGGWEAGNILDLIESRRGFR